MVFCLRMVLCRPERGKDRHWGRFSSSLQRIFPRSSFSESPFQRRDLRWDWKLSALAGIARAWPLAVKAWYQQGRRPRRQGGACSRRAQNRRRCAGDVPEAKPAWLASALQWPCSWRNARGEPASCFRSVPGETGRLQAGQDAETRSRSRRASRHPGGQAPGFLPASALSRPAPRQPWPTACQGIRQSRF